jgi:cholesterol oxidase
VRELESRPGGGYTVRYVEHTAEEEGLPSNPAAEPHIGITADRLVLAAGALGTPYLLLRNRDAFPGLSDKLGSRFCGNGDLLTILMRSNERKDGTRRPRVLEGSRGPVITSAIRVPDVEDGGDGRGFYIQDAGFPGFIDWMVEAANVPSGARRAANFVGRTLWGRLRRRPDSDLSAELGQLLGGCELSSGSMPLLGMGRDTPDGQMYLRGSQLEIAWTMASSRAYFNRVRDTMAAIADALDGGLRDNVLWRLKRVITVHPLGGAPMGRSRDEGVVDDHGEVFGHPGMYVVDGSVMPGPIGPNPSLTIAAFANRAAERIIETRHLTATKEPGT